MEEIIHQVEQHQELLTKAQLKQIKILVKDVNKFITRHDKRNSVERVDAGVYLYSNIGKLLQIVFEDSNPNKHIQFKTLVKMLMNKQVIKDLEDKFGKPKLKLILSISAIRVTLGEDNYGSDLMPIELNSQLLTRRNIPVNTKEGQVCLLKYIEGNSSPKIGIDGFFYMDSYPHSKDPSKGSLIAKFGKTNNLERRQVEQQSDHCASKLITSDITATENKFKAYFEELHVNVIEETARSRNMELVYLTDRVDEIIESLKLGVEGIKYNFQQLKKHSKTYNQLRKAVQSTVAQGIPLHAIITPPDGQTWGNRLSLRLLGELVTIVTDLMRTHNFKDTTETEVFNYCHDVIGLSHHDSKAKAERYSILISVIGQYNLDLDES